MTAPCRRVESFRCDNSEQEPRPSWTALFLTALIASALASLAQAAATVEVRGGHRANIHQPPPAVTLPAKRQRLPWSARRSADRISAISAKTANQKRRRRLHRRECWRARTIVLATPADQQEPYLGLATSWANQIKRQLSFPHSVHGARRHGAGRREPPGAN